MKLANGSHLTYCTNIHRGESWAETRAALGTYLPKIKANFAPGAGMGVGLRLSALAAGQLSKGEELNEFKDFLAANGFYVFTINGFPYGPFHGTRVKEEVYQPDWQFQERLHYSNCLADLLVELLPEVPDLYGSVSTVPGTFGPLANQPGVPEVIARNLMRHAAHLAHLFETTGKTIALALEPEPMCYLETTGDAVRFFDELIYSNRSVKAFASLTGLSFAGAETALRRHLGVCIDICHAAVEFEDPGESFALLRRSGIPIFKLQLSAALRVPEVDGHTKAALEPFDDGVYLHQVVERRKDGSLVRYLDLKEAFAAIGPALGHEWRIHCHVPVFQDELPELATTQDILRVALDMQKQSPLSQHLEVETYTFDVLPAELREVPADVAISRELGWVKARLAA
jgi:sugar phosphate isomerase/epimerase